MKNKNSEQDLSHLRKSIFLSRKIVQEIDNLSTHLDVSSNLEEKKMIFSQIAQLREKLKKNNEKVLQYIQRINVSKNLPTARGKISPPSDSVSGSSANFSGGRGEAEKKSEIKIRKIPKKDLEKFKISEIERQTLKRLGKKDEKISKEKIKKPSAYVKFSNKFFSNTSMKLEGSGIFRKLKRDLIKSNLGILPVSYISVILFTTLLSFIFSIFIFLFFSFLNINFSLPIFSLVQNIPTRLMKTIWIILITPLATFFFLYVYPSMEKKSTETKINQELPFAVVHMSAISGSMVEPSRIFSIIISTHEYPSLEKEFTKILNEINIYGYDLVSVLKNSAFNSPSAKLAELFNGMATTITSGGDLAEFFNKRAESLLFDHRIEREKYTKSAETFIDIYISVVIAAPMILMLLLMMMKISGLGIPLSTNAITLIMLFSVTVINIIFLAFMHLKQPPG